MLHQPVLGNPPSQFLGKKRLEINHGWWYTYPSEKYESQLGLLFPIDEKMKNVPNHQPDHGWENFPNRVGLKSPSEVAKSADPGLSQGRGGAWDHRRCGTCLS
jgi:hypothetical protein